MAHKDTKHLLAIHEATDAGNAKGLWWRSAPSCGEVTRVPQLCTATRVDHLKGDFASH